MPISLHRRQVLAAAKRDPGKITFASAGIGGAVHLGFGQFQYLTGTKLTHVPYKGEQPGVVDLVGGQVDLGIFLGFSAPQGTPPAVVQKLDEALVTALATPSVRDTLVARSVTPVGGKPEAYTDFLKKDIERSFKVIKAANIKLE